MSVAWVGAGIAAVGVVSGAANAKKAANAQEQSAQLANETQMAQYNQTREDQTPWRDAGMGALSQLTSRTGADGDLMRQFGASDFQADPGYQFRMNEGMRGLNNSAAARGGVLSGAALKAASRYNQDFASNEYSNAYNRYNTNQTNQFNRLASIAGVGQTANNALASAGSNMANNVSANQLGAGNARASGYVGQANAITGGMGSAYNMYQSNQLMNTLADRSFTGPTGGVGGYSDEMSRLNSQI
jgi:hypothetical protein